MKKKNGKRPKGVMHAARYSNSQRLQNLRNLFVRRGDHGATTQEIHDLTGSCAPATDVSELRHSINIEIDCTYDGLTSSGRRVYRYTMMS